MSPDKDLANALGVGAQLDSVITVVKSEDTDTVVKAADTLIQSNAISFEDDLFGQFIQEDNKPGHIKPPYDPLQLAWLCDNNNTLGIAIWAMEVNIDGTGFEISLKDGRDIESEKRGQGEEAPVDEEKESLKAFFREPWPGVSFITIRRQLRRDLECTGNAYLEVIRHPETKKILFVNYVDAKLVRLVKFDAPVLVSKAVERDGEQVEIMILENQRRYAQVLDNNLVFFKQFGVERELDKFTGFWEGPPNSEQFNDGEIPDRNAIASAPKPGVAQVTGEEIPPERRATELIHFTVNKDVITPYGVPRWIAQVPSVIGSRKAEELNLELFDSGGVPPVMILLQGGHMPKDARDNLTKYLAGKAKFKNRAVIAEIFSTSGDLNSANNVRATVEKFGAEQQKDSMFENYDNRCQERVRQSFRLPPLFIGRTLDYTRATAYTSYMVAEAQVFKPERIEFDEIINVTLMKELNPKYSFRSLDIGINDVEEQLKAFGLVTGDLANDQRVQAINEIAHLNLPIPPRKEDIQPQAGQPQDGQSQDGQPKDLQSTSQSGDQSGDQPKDQPGGQSGDQPGDQSGSPSGEPTRKAE